MLSKIVVGSENAFTVPILGVTPKDSLILQQITGLNPPDIDLYIGDYSRDGGVYQGRRVGNRNVVFTFGLNPNPANEETVAGWRDILYKAFVDPTVDADFIKVELHEDDGRVRYIVGYTEKFDTEPFAQDAVCQISTICPDPYLRDNVQTVLTSAGGWVVVPFDYNGTAETGFEVSITLAGDTSVLTLDNNGKQMVFNNDFLNGDIVYINTIRGSRDATLTRGGVTTPLIAKLTAISPWIELHSQHNTLKVYGASPTSLIAAIRSLKFTAAYWGI